MIEDSISFGEDRGLVGTICLPSTPTQISGLGMILFNAGVVHRVGPHRFNVRLGRRLAALGIPSIRFDLAGLGDSDRPRVARPFEEQAVLDIRSAMDELNRASGVGKFALFGFCSGAFHSYNAAPADERIVGMLLFDAYRYPTLKARLNRYAMRFKYHGAMSAVSRWLIKKIPFRGGSGSSATGSTSAESSVSAINFTPSKAQFASAIATLLDRGMTIGMLATGDGFEHYNYRGQFRDAFRRFGIADRMMSDYFPNMDHVATSLAEQGKLINYVDRWATKLANDGGKLPSRFVQAPRALHSHVESTRPSVIVLARTITGLATVRSLGRAGLDVHAIYFDKSDPVRFCSYGKKVYFDDVANSDDALLEAIIALARKLGNRPVVFATCDAHALLLARHQAVLDPVSRSWNTSYAALADIINKDGLYRNAAEAKIRTIPSITAPSLAEATEWSKTNPAPYLIKPFYTNIPTARLQDKNLSVSTRDELLAYLGAGTTDSLIVQRMIRGGDGYIFDCYGLCDHEGRIVTMATRRRWRQNVPDFGTCTHGEIPAWLDGDTEPTLFDHTERLIGKIRYHGIFMIEWLYDMDTGRFHVIDFNARPFMGIGHLTAAGLNLPALAYAELIGESMEDVEQRPALRRLFAVDMLRDLESFLAKRKAGQIGIFEWVRSILRCRHFYYTDWRDPVASVYRILNILYRAMRYGLKKVGTGLTPRH